jgi:hypothetical protein
LLVIQGIQWLVTGLLVIITHWGILETPLYLSSIHSISKTILIALNISSKWKSIWKI